MKLILMNQTITLLNMEAQKGNSLAIERIKELQQYSALQKENYLILKENQNE